ncbi:MAG: hypothetical protein ROO70_08975 [Labrenzia sp.]
MTFRTFLLIICLFLPIGFASAQEFDPKVFEEDVNAAISDMPGVSFTVTDGAMLTAPEKITADDIRSVWASQAIENAPEFGFVVYDKKGLPVDVLGGQAPFQTKDNNIEITGYKLPEGYTVSTVGSAGYAEAVSLIAQRVEAPSDDVEQAVQTVKGASAYIVQELCSAIGRPTEITLNLTAGFKLAFNVETGSEFHWDLEVVCQR